ncbi:MAG TPA: hypothetical protein VF703_02590 [Pyrinomonadaceae bacterium]|jgi:DNA-binding MarR family transcriptional regulator
MGLFDDILKGLPANAVLREKIEEARAKQSAIETEIAILKDDKRQLEVENQKLKDEIASLTHKPNIHEAELKILTLIAQDNDYGVAEVLVEPLKLPQQRVEYHLQELVSMGYLNRHFDLYGRNSYSLKQEGRKYLIDMNLL